MTERWCARGRHMVPVDEFRLDRNFRSGFHPWCRSCVSSYNREWREANYGSVEAYNQQRREEYAREHGPLERMCANPECGAMFTPSRRDARTCSRVCRSRVAQRRRTERDRARREGQA